MTWHKWRQPGLSRRAFLGGAAATITLPLLPSLLGRASRADSTLPVRLVFWYVPNGMHMPAFTPTTEGADYTLPTILSPLANVRDDVLVLSGLSNLAGSDDRAGDHARGTAAFLTCVTPSYEGVSVGISVDQVAAQHHGAATPYASLQVGVDSGANLGTCDSGYSCAYSNNISWAGPGTPLPKIINPQLLFDRLFAGFDAGLSEADRARRLAWRGSVLDHAAGEATTLANRLDAADRARLDEYLTGVRELERRLASGDLRSCDPPGRPPADTEIEQRIDLMSELMVTALRCDLTRTITFMGGNAASGRNYSFIGAPGAHHEISHHQDQPELHEKLVTIGTWEVERLAVFLSRLRDVPEGDGTLLDQTAVVFGSEIGDGNRHNHDDLPFLVAGRAGGAIAPGRHLRRDGVPVADLYLSLLGAAGVPATTFGQDGTAPLAGLAEG
jgi:hypothetical protein